MSIESERIAKEKLRKMQTEAPDSTPIIVTPTLRGRFAVVVVGGGGTGARVVPALSQMLRRGDSLSVVDHDIVEDRNLIRQNFNERDIGSNKAEVLSRRYRRDGITSNAFAAKIRQDMAREAIAAGGFAGVILLGCVDNAAARRDIAQVMTYLVSSLGVPGVWIDAGNETRGGQVIVTMRSWQAKVVSSMVPRDPTAYSMEGMSAMPQLLRDAAQDTPSCADRIDLQTVQVNAMAACTMINCVSWFLLGLPFTSAGTFFSTLNTMQPIKIASVVNRVLIPDATYAINA